MSVPASTCLIIDYSSASSGLTVPKEGSWPQLKSGLSAEEPLTWDLLMALALLDGLVGDGGTLWGRYCQAILPVPEALTTPMCWSGARLDELQHTAIKEAALQQQVREERSSPLGIEIPCHHTLAYFKTQHRQTPPSISRPGCLRCFPPSWSPLAKVGGYPQVSTICIRTDESFVSFDQINRAGSNGLLHVSEAEHLSETIFTYAATLQSVHHQGLKDLFTLQARPGGLCSCTFY